MKKAKMILAAILSVTIILGGTIPSYAASTDVTIEVEATAMDRVSVTVPTTLPILFNEDGSNTLPTNWTIENRSAIAGIHLASVSMDAKTTGWKLMGSSGDTRVLKADTKTIQFSVGKSGALKMITPTSGSESATGMVEFDDADIVIPSGQTQVLSFTVSRGAFTKASAAAKAFDMVLTFAFN